jgi:acyl-CoA thioester hydrolase
LVVSTDITYLAPLKFRYGSVFVDTWVCEVRAASFALAYEIYDEREGERILYARARTVLTPYVFSRKAPRRLTAPERTRLIEAMEPDEPVRPTPIRAVVSELGHFALHTRFSDLDIYGHVNNVKYVEYFQEGRGALLTRASQAVGRRASGGHVVAQVRIEYVRPLLYREQPYDLFTSVSHLGTKSMTMEAEIRDGDVVCARARAAVVFYDPEAALRRRSRTTCASTSLSRTLGRILGSILGSVLGRVDHELRRMCDVIPKARVLLGRECHRVQSGPEMHQPTLGRVRGDRERGVSHPQARMTTVVRVRRRPAPVLHQEQVEPLFGRTQVLFWIHRPQIRVGGDTLVELGDDLS